MDHRLDASSAGSSPGRRAGRLVPRSPGRKLLVAPSVLWTLVFFFVPMAILVVYSFGRINLLTFDVEFGWTFENYKAIFEGVYLTTVGRSILLSLGATIGCLAIGFPLAYAISRQEGRRQTLLLVAVMVPFWTSFVVRTYSMVNLLGDQGPLASLLETLGLVDDGIRLLYTPWAVGIGMVYTYLPLMVLPIYVALERVDRSLVQAAADLGAPPRRTFRRVILPLAAPGVAAGCVLVGVPATGEYVVPAILGGGKTLMYGNVVASQFEGIGNYPFGSALAVTLTAIVTVVLVVSRRRGAEAEVVL